MMNVGSSIFTPAGRLRVATAREFESGGVSLAPTLE
jgi:hypothetical protein